jgi:hypothetical protein
MLQGVIAEIQTLRQFSRKQCFIVPTQTQQTRVQRLTLRTKRVSPYVSLQAGYGGNKIKTRFNPYAVIWNSIGYFTLVIYCPSTPNAM